MTMIKHIKETKCPHCGATPNLEEVTSVHCNGQQFETRRFKCGHEIRWVPNFEAAEVSSACPFETKQVKVREKRIIAAEQLTDFLAKLDVDQKFKDLFKDKLLNYKFYL